MVLLIFDQLAIHNFLRLITDNLNIPQASGYRQKYLKYKAKYLQLKQLIKN